MLSGALKALLAISFLCITSNPATVAGGSFGRIVQADSIIEDRGGTVVVIPQDPQVGKLSFLLATNTHIKKPAVVADTFVRRAESPILLASMGMWETRSRLLESQPQGGKRAASTNARVDRNSPTLQSHGLGAEYHPGREGFAAQDCRARRECHGRRKSLLRGRKCCRPIQGQGVGNV